MALDDPQNGSDLSPANNEENATGEGRGMRIKKPTIKVTENAEEFTSVIDEVMSHATKKHDDDFVPDMAEIDPSSSDEDTPTILEVSRQKKGAKIETGIFFTVSVILYLCLLELVLFVPTGRSQGSKRVTMPIDTEFDNALEIIHDAIGCTNIVKKPTLKYRMAKTGCKAIMLDTPDDWIGMIQHAKRLVQTQKDKSIVLGELDIESEVCLILGIYLQYSYGCSILMLFVPGSMVPNCPMRLPMPVEKAVVVTQKSR